MADGHNYCCTNKSDNQVPRYRRPECPISRTSLPFVKLGTTSPLDLTRIDNCRLVPDAGGRMIGIA